MSYPTLDLCRGPMCPYCGCTDAAILEQPRPELENVPLQPGRDSWFGSAKGRRNRSLGSARCNHCRALFTFRELPEDPLPVIPETPPEPLPIGNPEKPRCPDCHSEDVKVTSTRPAHRWYKCRMCGGNFKVPK